MFMISKKNVCFFLPETLSVCSGVPAERAPADRPAASRRTGSGSPQQTD